MKQANFKTADQADRERAAVLLAKLEQQSCDHHDVPQHYEVNVARMTVGGSYEHLFATHERSGTRSNIGRVLMELLDRFPAPEFRVSITAKYAFGREMTGFKQNGE